MDDARQQLFEKYHVDPNAWLGRGMEAEVYAYGPDTVFKLYAESTNLQDLSTLRDFYDRLDRQNLPYALPHIHRVVREGRFLVTIEQRLAGTPLSSVLPTLTADELLAVMQRCLSAVLALSQSQTAPTFNRYKLFDPEQLSARGDGDWNTFLTRYIQYKLAQVAAYLRRDVPQFDARIQQLYTLLDQPYRGAYQLIHGDFFPGNLLINADLQITALLDFGLLTMYGDWLFDVAMSWVFFDMYDELHVQARERYLAMTFERLGEPIRGTLYRYVLIYSIISANSYSATCSDGHYAWCVANLSTDQYWDAVE